MLRSHKSMQFHREMGQRQLAISPEETVNAAGQAEAGEMTSAGRWGSTSRTGRVGRDQFAFSSEGCVELGM